MSGRPHGLQVAPCNGLTPDVCALWLMLKTGGGWWTAARLTPSWHPTFQPHEVQQALDALEAGGYIESCDQAGDRIYGVSPACEAPPDDVLRAGHVVLHERPAVHVGTHSPGGREENQLGASASAAGL